ncbi:MAG: hypothetical protein P9E24_11740 [Candidatus Competibacter sp.]|nr:hypothetical protein [Candidatus Competibacter sp.]MDG4582547.1 hypothetical protein [Candidatus Competibacter sp.]
MSDPLQPLWRLPLLVLAGALIASGAQAQSGYRQRGDERGPPPRQFADPDRAANAARRATGGRVLGVQGSERDGQPGYRVRILQPDGRVRSLHYDADSGAVRD